MSANERSGWRDEAISLRHRKWGYNCPAVDLDFLVVEYNIGEPVALIEYKHEQAQTVDRSHPTYRALLSLAEKASLPFMVVIYRRDPWRFLVLPINDRAKAVYSDPSSLSERRFVGSLYWMRSRVVEQKVLDGLAQTQDTIESWQGSAMEVSAA